VWDGVCGECGGNQPALLPHRRAELDESRRQADKHVTALAFAEALAIADKVIEESHPELADFKEWASDFIIATRVERDRYLSAKAERDRQVSAVAERVKEARRHLDACDHDSAIHTLDDVAKPLHTQELRDLLFVAQQRRTEVADLTLLIREGIKNSELSGLIPKVARALEVGGDRADLKKLHGQLCERRDAKMALVREAFTSGQSRRAAALAADVDEDDAVSSDVPFLKSVRAAGEMEPKLAALVKDAKESGGMTFATAEKIHPLASELLKFNPDAKQVEALARQCKQLLLVVNSIGMELKGVSPGTFTMGSMDVPGETPHEVRLTQHYYLGLTPVTNAQWKSVMGSVPSELKNDDHPVHNVSWDDAILFCKKLSALPAERKAGRVYRLPTEAEWEYACRAGTRTDYSFGDDASLLGAYAWFVDNAGGQTRPVGQKQPNAWGFYDIHGNVWEWCSDWYRDYPASAVSDPKGPSTGSDRVLRGGGWLGAAGRCRSARRNWSIPSFRNSVNGFRLALSPSGASSPEASE
jgi:formylglycine-generating enzyme required for sulfatase activity